MEKLPTDKNTIPIMMITWNRFSYTKQAIESILNNTKHPFILWIWDNNSIDGTADYLKSIEDDRVQFVFSPENVGLIPPMNEFFNQYPDTEYAAKVDNDTVVPEGWLGKLKYVMDSLPLFVVQANLYLGLPFKLKNNQQFYNQLLRVEFERENLYLFPHVGGSGILIKRKHIDKPIEIMEGSLSGWVGYQIDKSIKENLCCAFYSGVWVDRLDAVGTNKIKYDYPDYLKEINRMRNNDENNSGFGVIDLNMEGLRKYREIMRKNWEIQNLI